MTMMTEKPEVKRMEVTIGDKLVTIETGKYAKQATCKM